MRMRELQITEMVGGVVVHLSWSIVRGDPEASKMVLEFAYQDAGELAIVCSQGPQHGAL